MKRIILAAALSITIAPVFGQIAPVYSNDFMDIGVGARALGMANSVTASVNDVTAGYWNPAGLTGVPGNIEISLMHDDFFAGIGAYDYAALAARIDSVSNFGVTFLRFGVDNIPNTTQLIDANGNVNYNNITSFSVADYAFLFSYARKFGIPGLSLGANVKVIHSIVGSFASSWGFGFDVGGQYQYKDWQFGAVGRDVTSTFNAWSYTLDQATEQIFQETGNIIPTNGLEITLPRLLLGAGRNFHFFKNKVSLLAEVDADLTFDGLRNTLITSNTVSVDPHCGFEVGYRNIVFLRMGLGNIQQTTDPTGQPVTTFQPDFGVGLKIKSFYLDYTLTNLGGAAVAPYSNIFSLKFDIYRKEKK